MSGSSVPADGRDKTPSARDWHGTLVRYRHWEGLDLGSRKRRSAVAIIAATVAALGLASLGGAAVPGQNGRIAFDRYSNGSDFADIFTMKPDGSDLIKLTRRSPEDDDTQPAYSPDGNESPGPVTTTYG